MAAVTSRFVYITRGRQDIIERVTKGEFISLLLDVQDSPERTRKYPSYLVTKYPIDVDPSLALELPGVHSARRFRQNGLAINRIVVTWKLLDPPPSTLFCLVFSPAFLTVKYAGLLMTSQCVTDVGNLDISHATAMNQRSVLGAQVNTIPAYANTVPPSHLPLPRLLLLQSTHLPSLMPTGNVLDVTNKE